MVLGIILCSTVAIAKAYLLSYTIMHIKNWRGIYETVYVQQLRISAKIVGNQSFLYLIWFIHILYISYKMHCYLWPSHGSYA